MTPGLHFQFILNWEASSKRQKNFSSHFQGSPNALPRMASPEIGHMPQGCLGVPLSGQVSLLPSDRVSGLSSLAGDWGYFGGLNRCQHLQRCGQGQPKEVLLRPALVRGQGGSQVF